MEKKPLSLHEKILLALVGVAGVIVAFYMLLYQPQREAIAELRDEVAAKQKEVAQYADFDQTIAKANMDAQEYSAKIDTALLGWYTELNQKDIINSLSPKIKNCDLNDSTITFVNTQTAQIAPLMEDDDDVPTLADALAIAYLEIVKEETEKANNPSTSTSDTTSASDTASTSAPASDGTSEDTEDTADTETSNANTLPTEVNKESGIDEDIIDAEVQKRFDELNSSLQKLSDAELQNKINEIVHNTVANIQKLTVVITFDNSTYQSILDFVYSIEANYPNIYISELSYDDSTDAYLQTLKSAVENEMQEIYGSSILTTGAVEQVSVSDIFSNAYPSASLAASQIAHTSSGKLLTKAQGQKYYTGSITLTYFAISQMPGQV